MKMKFRLAHIPNNSIVPWATMCLICSLATLSHAQSFATTLTPSEENALRMNASPAAIHDTLLWKREGQLNVHFSQVHLSNWSAGGQSNISLLTKFDHVWNYDHHRFGWDTEVHLAFGMLHRPEDKVILKTDDRIEWTSKWGYRLTETGFMTVMANFRSQFAPGYSIVDGIPNRSVLRSNWMAPGYGVVAAGMDYKHESGNFTLFFAPFTYKGTWVLDDSLSQQGAFGVEPDTPFRYEVGGYIKMGWKIEIVENVSYSMRLDLFSNFLNNPQNIDLFTDQTLNLKVNPWLTTTISASLIYDDDVTLEKNPVIVEGVSVAQYGPGMQLKEVLSVGVSVKF